MQPPQCGSCGAIVTHPSATQCTYCGAAIQAPPTPYGYGQAPYGPPGAQPPYGQSPYGQPPYGQPYGQPPVAGFHGAPVHGWRTPTQQGGGFWGTMGTVGNVVWWIRVGIAVAVLGMVLLGSCVSALSH